MYAITALTGNLFAATILHTGTFEDVNDGTFLTQDDSVPGGGSSFLTESTVTGIPKFDPALGTLDEVIVSSTFNYEAFGELLSGSVSNGGMPFSASASGAVHDLGIYYRRTSDPGTLRPVVATTVFFQDTYFCDDDGSGTDCSDFYFDQGAVNDGNNIINDIDLSDFVGSGDVSVLIAAIFTPSEVEFNLENLDEASLEFNASMSEGEIFVTYNYTVPEPSQSILLLSAMIMIGARRKRQ